MARRFALLAVGAVALALPILGTGGAAGQEVPACASAFWLEPLAAESTPTGETLPAGISEPSPAWLTAELTDACSGEQFTLADFAGKTVYIESMATWCPPCRDQLTRVKEAAARIPEAERDAVVFVALSSEVDLPRETLADYAEANDFPFIFAVLPAQTLQAVVDDLGQEMAVPPATPHLILAPDGSVGEVHTGGAAPDELLALIAAAQEDSGS